MINCYWSILSGWYLLPWCFNDYVNMFSMSTNNHQWYLPCTTRAARALPTLVAGDHSSSPPRSHSSRSKSSKVTLETCSVQRPEMGPWMGLGVLAMAVVWEDIDTWILVYFMENPISIFMDDLGLPHDSRHLHWGVPVMGNPKFSSIVVGYSTIIQPFWRSPNLWNPS